MKKVILLALSMISLTAIQAQWFSEPIIVLDTARLQVMYKLTFIEDTNHINFTKAEKQMLLTGTSSSSYQSYNFYKYNKTGRKKVQEGNLMEWLQGGISANDYACVFHYVIYKFHRTNIIVHTEYIFSADTFRYEENGDIFKWETGGDTDTILGFVCQNAFCDFGGRRWEAWFAPEVPYSDGPYKFCGLPGLILKISDKKEHYIFEALSIEIPDKQTLVEYSDRDYVNTTKKEFFKVYDNNNRNLTNTLLDRGVSANSIQHASQDATSKNNPIELDRK